MNIKQKKKARAAQVEAYWQKVEGNTEYHVTKVVKKFGLRFATLIMDSDESQRDATKAFRAEGMAVLAGVSTNSGDMASFFFHV